MEPELELGQINVLIGANGSGKSNFVSFFKMMNELVSERLEDYIGRSGGADSVLHYGSKLTSVISAELKFETEVGRIEYSVRLAHAVRDSLWINDERILSDVPAPSRIIVGIGAQKQSVLGRWRTPGDPTAEIISDQLRRCRTFHFHDTSETAKIRLSGYIEANQNLYADGSNLAAMLYLYQETKPSVYHRIVLTVRHIMPMFDDFLLEPQRINPRNILLNWKQKGREHLFGSHQLSDGTLRAMALITLFLQPTEDLPSVIIVDEPELGLHPHAIEIIAGLIRAASLETQIILTTQSTTFLDHFEPEEIIVVDARRGHTILRRLKIKELKYWLKDYSVGRLWEKNVLGGGPLS